MDAFSLGVIMYVLLWGKMPFFASSGERDAPRPHDYHLQTLSRFYGTEMPGCGHVPVSPEARDLLHKLLDPNPLTRITPEQALSHPWLARRSTSGGTGGRGGGSGGGGGGGRRTGGSSSSSSSSTSTSDLSSSLSDHAASSGGGGSSSSEPSAKRAKR